MAQKRMFSNLVIGSDDFLEMPDSSQNLYFYLSMQADDDGFVDNWKSVMRMTGKKEDDLKILITKSFVIPFDSGLLVIKHWKLNNYIQKDRYKETIHKSEKALLKTDENNVYILDTTCIQDVYTDKNRLDENSIDKISSSSSNNINNNNNIKSDSCLDGSRNANDSCLDGLQSVNDSCFDDLQDIINFYNNNIGLATQYTQELFEDFLKELPKDLIILAMQKSVEANVRNIKYIKAILNDWSKSGIKSVLQAEEEDRKFKHGKTEKTVKETTKEKIERYKREWGLEDET